MKTIYDIFILKVDNQIVENSKAERVLEQDMFNKKAAIDIDTVCRDMSNCSTNITNHAGMERIIPANLPQTWHQNTVNNIKVASGL